MEAAAADLAQKGTVVGQYPTYSIVIPAYNESGRIPATLDSVVSCIRSRGWSAEVLVVNDGSTDNTAQVVRDFARQAPEIRLLENPGNRGKGYSVRSGILNALGDVVMFTDADLSAFAAHRGKLIMVENMADYAQSHYAGIEYYKSVLARMGGMIHVFKTLCRFGHRVFLQGIGIMLASTPASR